MVAAVIFDFDGLILDTEWPEVEAWESIFAKYGASLPADWWQALIGRGADQELETPTAILHQALAIKHGSQAPSESEINREAHELRLELVAKQEARPGIRELLSECEESGVKVGIASSSRHAWLKHHLQRLNLFERFAAIACADDVARTKPAPDVYRCACQRLGVLPAMVVAIEDSPAGITAAQAAQIRTLAYPNRLTEQMDISHADRVIHNPADLSLSTINSLLS